MTKVTCREIMYRAFDAAASRAGLMISQNDLEL